MINPDKTVTQLVSQVNDLKAKGEITFEQMENLNTVLKVVFTDDYVAKGLTPETAKMQYNNGLITKGMLMKELECWAFEV